MKKRQIELEYPELDVTITADLAEDKNPSKCNVLWDNLPLEFIQGHAFSSGDRMSTHISRIVSDVQNEWADPRGKFPLLGNWEEKWWGRVPIKRGSIGMSFKPSFYGIDIIYGQMREAIAFAPVAQVVDKDIEKLVQVGNAVWEGWMEQKGYKLIVRRKKK